MFMYIIVQLSLIDNKYLDYAFGGFVFTSDTDAYDYMTSIGLSKDVYKVVKLTIYKPDERNDIIADGIEVN